MWSPLLYAGHKQFYLWLYSLFCGTFQCFFNHTVKLKSLTVLHTVEGSIFLRFTPLVHDHSICPLQSKPIFNWQHPFFAFQVHACTAVLSTFATHTQQMGKPQCKPQCKHGLLYLSMILSLQYQITNWPVLLCTIDLAAIIYRGCLLHRYNYRGCLLHRHETENGVPEVCTWSITHTNS